MKTRYHQYLTMFIVAFLIILTVQSVLLGNPVLDWLSLLSMYLVLISIIFGLVIAAYVRITRNQIVDPLNSELDDE